MVISLGVHAAALVVLGLVSFAGGRQLENLVLVSSTVADSSEPLEELVIESPPLELTPLEPASLTAESLPTVDVGSVALAAPQVPGGELAGADAVPDVAGEPSREIGRIVAQDRALGRQPASRTAASAEFFGVKAHGQRFVFVVDSSRSMRGRRFVAACHELRRALGNLASDQRFYVILFDEHPERMRLPPDDQPPPRPVRATRSNLRRFGQWLSGVTLEAGTGPHEALAWALEMQPDAVYVLSDGQFGARAEQYLEEHNWREGPTGGRVPRTVIHAVGFDSRQGGDALRRIATRFGGSYRFVQLARR